MNLNAVTGLLNDHMCRSVLSARMRRWSNKNRALKVLGGLAGIKQHPHTLAHFFLIAPQLQKKCIMSGCTARANIYKHHLDNAKATQSQEVVVVKLQQEINQLGFPFTIDDHS